LFIACSLLCLLLSQNKYRDIPGITILFHDKKHLKNVGPIRHCEPPHCHSPGVATVARRHCRSPPAHRYPQQQRQQRQRVTEGTAMAPQNGPNKYRG